jgi:hypothetical protein
MTLPNLQIKQNNDEQTQVLGIPETTDNITHFKETLITILISYFKNNVILLNNLVELSDKIITKIDNLRLLIWILIEEPISAVYIDVEEINPKNCCNEICNLLPRYKKIKRYNNL